MPRVSPLWKANIIAFVSSFCVMVIELIASRILAPYIGVSLYTWTSIIGVILAGIALGNFIGGRIADRHPHPSILLVIFLTGSLATIAILPFIKIAANAAWFAGLPVMLNFTLRTACVFFLPAVILSMVSPMVIKLALADLGRAGGVVGTIYAFSTAGSILGTFMTGFYFILWFGVRNIIWLAAIILLLTGFISWFSWKVPDRWKKTAANVWLWSIILFVLLAFAVLFQFRTYWQEKYTGESNYYTINVTESGNLKMLKLDHLVHSYVYTNSPATLFYDYEKIFAEITGYLNRSNPAPAVLHLGGGGYVFPRYLETVYPGSSNTVVEIDPMVSRVAYDELGLSRNTKIKTYNLDARLFLLQANSGIRYDIVIGDVFNDLSTPYHLTTLEFDQSVKKNMTSDGVYLINIIDDFQKGRYLPSFIFTLRNVFKNIILLSPSENLLDSGRRTFVIAASDRDINLEEYTAFVSVGKTKNITGHPYTGLEEYLLSHNPVLLTDDYAPTDILVAPLFSDK